MDTAKQMEMAFMMEEGGLTDDGSTVDPVSGNEVPPGSLAEEVRDDIPAQLSEGEYVVPADVVRFYGVKFFEDLRGEAKRGMMEMEANGRIGGEPIEMSEGDVGDLTPEEVAALEQVTGMAMGGSVQANPYLQQQQMYSQGYAEGGDVDPNVPQFTQQTGMSFAPGFLAQQMAPEYGGVPTTPTIVTEETVESCAAKGMNYDPQTKTCVPKVVAPTATVPTTSNDDSPAVEPPKWYDKYDYGNPEAVVAKSLEMLGVSPEDEDKETQSTLEKITSSVGSGISSFFENNILLGGIIKQQKVAEVAANAQLLRAQGRSDEADLLEKTINAYREKNNIEPGGFFDSTKTLSRQLSKSFSDLGFDEETGNIIKIGSTTTKPPTPETTPETTPEPTSESTTNTTSRSSSNDDNDSEPIIRPPSGPSTTVSTTPPAASSPTASTGGGMTGSDTRPDDPRGEGQYGGQSTSSPISSGQAASNSYQSQQSSDYGMLNKGGLMKKKNKK